VFRADLIRGEEMENEMWNHEERDALAAALSSKQDQIVRLEAFLRVFDRELLKKGVTAIERKAIHDAILEAGAQVALNLNVG
jgi:hypothetical protein